MLCTRIYKWNPRHRLQSVCIWPANLVVNILSLVLGIFPLFLYGQTQCFLLMKLLIPATFLFFSGLRKWQYLVRVLSLKWGLEISATSWGPPKSDNLFQRKACLSGPSFERGCFMLSSYKFHWSDIKNKDACPDGSTITPSTWLCLHQKCPPSQGFQPIAQNVLESSLPSNNRQDGVSLFPQKWSLAVLGKVSYNPCIKNVMLFISRHQKSAHVIFCCIMFSHLVNAPCWRKLTPCSTLFLLC